MKRVDFRSCSPDHLLPLWERAETKARQIDTRLWTPPDLSRRLEYALKEARSEPSIQGQTILEGEQARAFMLFGRRRVGEAEAMRAIYPPSIGFSYGIAFGETVTPEEAVSLGNALFSEAALFQVNALYCTLPLSAHQGREAMRALGFEDWIMLAQRPTRAYLAPDPASFKGVIRAAKRSETEPLGELWAEMIRFHAQSDPRCDVNADLPLIYHSELFYAMRDPDHRLLVAELDGKLIGEMHCSLYRVETEQRLPLVKPGVYGYVASASVTESARGNGVGKALFQAACQWFLSRHVEAIHLHYNTGNPLSPGFWQSVGFEPMAATLYRKGSSTSLPK